MTSDNPQRYRANKPPPSGFRPDSRMLVSVLDFGTRLFGNRDHFSLVFLEFELRRPSARRLPENVTKQSQAPGSIFPGSISYDLENMCRPHDPFSSIVTASRR